eukprot:9124102-Pyramimonas_sp.AAC.1
MQKSVALKTLWPVERPDRPIDDGEDALMATRSSSLTMTSATGPLRHQGGSGRAGASPAPAEGQP